LFNLPPDLYVLAIGYGGMLKMKKSSWIPEGEFHTVSKEKKMNATSNTSSNSALGVIGARRDGSAPKSDKSKSDAPPDKKATTNSDAKRAPPPPSVKKAENGSLSKIKEEKESKSRESKEPKGIRDVKVLGRNKDIPKDIANNGLKVEDHIDDSVTSSPAQAHKSSRASQSPLNVLDRRGRGSSEDADADTKIEAHREDRTRDTHRSSRSVENLETSSRGLIAEREASILSNSDDEDSPMPQRSGGRRTVDDDEENVSHKETHKRRKVEAKSHESPKHKEKKEKNLADGSRIKVAKRARRSPSLEYEVGSVKRSRQEGNVTNGSDGTHKERKTDKDKGPRDRGRDTGLSSRESSPAVILSKERKEERKEERKMKEREHDRLLALAAGAPIEDRRKVVEPLLGDGHKKSKHGKEHRNK
jgi:hypothetical protein